MNHLIVIPVVLPAIVAALTLLGMRFRLWLGRALSFAAVIGLLGVAIALLGQADTGLVQSYSLGNWPAPFGIVLVLDRLSALMLGLTALLATVVLAHAVLTGLDRRGWHFHPLFHFQLLGLNGAFLTGDLFNLFVFFEVLLIASYGLMLHGQGAARLQAGVQYVIVNLVGSTLFLVAIGILYGVTGTLNMADMALRVAAAPAEDQGLIRAGAQLLTAVFALKAAILPLHLWLPRTYSSTSAPVAALFAILTKVGVYSILRVTTLVFGPAAGLSAWAPESWMLPAALMTTLVAFLGVLAAKRLRLLATFAMLASTATLLVSVSLFDRDAAAAALYYLPHSTLAGALLFLVVDLICRRRPEHDDLIAATPRFAGIERLSLLYMLAAIALVGLPPLSGFVGKLLILDAARPHPAAGWVWAIILGTTLIGIIGFARAGSLLFWKSAASSEPTRPAPPSLRAIALLPAATLIGALGALTVLAGPASDFARAAADQLFFPVDYVAAVLAPGAEG